MRIFNHHWAPLGHREAIPCGWSLKVDPKVVLDVSTMKFTKGERTLRFHFGVELWFWVFEFLFVFLIFFCLLCATCFVLWWAWVWKALLMRCVSGYWAVTVLFFWCLTKINLACEAMHSEYQSKRWNLSYLLRHHFQAFPETWLLGLCQHLRI